MFLLKKILIGYCNAVNLSFSLMMAMLLLVIPLSAQEKTISGIISDDDAVPLPGVNVFIKGSNTGTVSDFDGNFIINAQPGDVLVFSFVGFESQELTVGDADSIDISMVADGPEEILAG